MAVMKYLVTQYNLKAGLKHFGEKGTAAAKGELTQLHVMDAWVPKDPTMLSRSEKVKSLSSLMFLKEKRSGKVKGRVCVNGAPQRAPQSRRSVIGNLPYDQYLQFLQTSGMLNDVEHDQDSELVTQ